MDYDVDFSCFDFPSVIWGVLPPAEIIIKVSIVAPLAIFGIIGNVLLICTILGDRSLKSPTNYLIANMSISDLCTLLFSPALVLFHEIFQNYKLGIVGCKVEATIEVSFLITSVITLCFVSYERLTAIAFPMQARLTLHDTKVVIVASWICGLILSSPLAIFKNYTERQWRNFLEAFCSENVNVLPLYWHVIIVALVWIPLVVLIFCYTTIFIKLDQYERVRKRRDHPLTISYKRKFAKTLFIVVVTFFVLRIPFTTFVFMRSYRLQSSEINSVDGIQRIHWYISRYLIFLNCALTPCVYGLTNENFRRAFRRSKCHKYFCMCAPGSISKTVAVYSINHQDPQSHMQEPRTRNPISDKKIFSQGWFKSGKLSKFSTSKNQNAATRSQDRFHTTDAYM
ncbi:substance-K receptor [Chironomus tepperi]|uniref:substance-K receptor n=1 Tax=Chironomus tepperi TaxID=113505 RepID=UPI00391F9409